MPPAKELEKGRLLSGVNFFLSFSSSRVERELKKVITSNGGSVLNYLIDMVDYVITDSPDHTDVQEAVEIFEKTILRSEWVKLSLACKTLLPVQPFCLLKKQLFSSIVVCPSSMTLDDTEAIWAIVTYFGGSFQIHLDAHVTHLVTTAARGVKYTESMKHPEKIKIVTPDWVTDSAKNKCLCDEELYHPSLLLLQDSESQLSERSTNQVTQPFLKPSLQGPRVNCPGKVSSPVTSGLVSSGSFSSFKVKDTPSTASFESRVQPIYVTSSKNKHSIHPFVSSDVVSSSHSSPPMPTNVKSMVNHPVRFLTFQTAPGTNGIRFMQFHQPQNVLQMGSCQNAIHQQIAEKYSQQQQQQQQEMTQVDQQPRPTDQMFLQPPVRVQFNKHLVIPSGPMTIERQKFAVHGQQTHRVQVLMRHPTIQCPISVEPSMITHLAQVTMSPGTQTIIRPINQTHGLINPGPFQAEQVFHIQQQQSVINQTHQTQQVQFNQANELRMQQMAKCQQNFQGPVQMQHSAHPQFVIQHQSQTLDPLNECQPNDQVPTPQQQEPKECKSKQRKNKKVNRPKKSVTPRKPRPKKSKQIKTKSDPKESLKPIERTLPQMPQLVSIEQFRFERLLEPPEIFVQYYTFDPPVKLPSKLCFFGCFFYLTGFNEETTPNGLTFTPEQMQNMTLNISKFGGTLLPVYDAVRVTHVIVDTQAHPIVIRARIDGKRVVNIYWLEDVLLTGNFNLPEKALHFPRSSFISFAPQEKLDQLPNCLVSFRDEKIALSGFSQDQICILKEMIIQIGAQYTLAFSGHNTLLISNSNKSEKFLKAQEWLIPVVSAHWLVDAYLGLNDAHEKPFGSYHFRHLQFYSSHPFELDWTSMRHLFAGWNVPIQLNSDLLATKMSSLLTSLSLSEAEIAKKAPTSSTGPMFAAPIRTANRTRTSTATSTTTKSESFVPFPVKKLSHTEVDPFVAPSVLRPTGSNIRYESNYRILATGFTVEKLKELQEIVKKLNGKFTSNPIEVTHLVIDAPVTTLKFLFALNYTQFIVHYDWLYASNFAGKFVPEINYTYDAVGKLLEKRNINKSKHPKTGQVIGKLFSSFIFFITPTVNPSVATLTKLIHSTASGHVITDTLPTKAQLDKLQAQNYKFVFIAAESDYYLVQSYKCHNIPILNPSFILTCILQQQIVPLNDFSLDLVMESKKHKKPKLEFQKENFTTQY